MNAKIQYGPLKNSRNKASNLNLTDCMYVSVILKGNIGEIKVIHHN